MLHEIPLTDKAWMQQEQSDDREDCGPDLSDQHYIDWCEQQAAQVEADYAAATAEAREQREAEQHAARTDRMLAGLSAVDDAEPPF